MSEAKSPKKADAGSKAPEVKKAEVKKPEATQSAPVSETPSADKAVDKLADKSVATPKSASQSSISHFSSVSTPAYRAGWNTIFGGENATEKSKSNTNGASKLPIRVTIADDNIDAETRAILYKALRREAHNQGIDIVSTQDRTVVEYKIECDVRDK